MMFGFRTPAKTNMDRPAKSPEKAGDQTNPMTPERLGSPIVVIPSVPTKPKIKKMTQDSDKQIRKMTSAEKEGHSEEPKYKNRTTEAKACLTKAKLHLGNSRNLRTDIKAEVTQAIERLYALVREAETDKEENKRQREESPREKEEERQKEETKKTGDELIERLEKYEKLLKENNTAIENLKNSIERKLSDVDKNTYASVAAAGPQKRNPTKTALHSVVVTSKNEMETSDEVLKQIIESVNAKDGWVKVERVRKIKNQRVIVGCATEEERNKVKERLEKAKDKLTVENIKNKNPLIIIKDVLSYNTDLEIMCAFKKQNKSIFCNLSEEEQNIETCFRRKTRNPHACHIVMRVPTKVWQRATEAEAVHIDLQKVRVADHSPLVQCSQCLGYGHTRRFCKEKTTKCSHCGGPHTRTECLDWIANVPPKCCNCTRAGLDSVTEHNAFSHDCPVRRKWDALARSSLAYC